MSEWTRDLHVNSDRVENAVKTMSSVRAFAESVLTLAERVCPLCNDQGAQMAAANEQLTAANDQLQQQLQQMEADEASRQQEMDDKLAKIQRQLDIAVQEGESLRKALADKDKTTASAHNDAERELTMLRKRLMENGAAVASKDRALEMKDEELATLQETMATALEKSKEEREALMADMESELEEVRVQLHQMEQCLAAKDSDCTSLEARLSALQSCSQDRITALEGEVHLQQEKADMLQEENTVLAQQLQTMAAKVRETAVRAQAAEELLHESQAGSVAKDEQTRLVEAAMQTQYEQILEKRCVEISELEQCLKLLQLEHTNLRVKLDNTVEDSERVRVRLAQQCEDYKSQLYALQDKQSRESLELASLKTVNAELSARVEQLTEGLSASQENLSRRLASEEQTSRRLSELLTEAAEEQKKRVEAYQEREKHLQDTISELKRVHAMECERLSSAADKSKGEADVVRVEQQTTMRQLQDAMAESDIKALQYTDQIKLQRETIEVLQTSLAQRTQDHETEVWVLKQEADALRSRVDVETAAQESLQNQVRALEEEAKALRHAVTEKDSDSSALTGEIADLKRRLVQTYRETENVINSLRGTHTSQIEELMTRIEILEHSKIEIVQRYESVTVELRELRVVESELRETIIIKDHGLQQRVEEIEREKELLMQQLETKTKEMTHLQCELTSECSTLRMTVQQLREELVQKSNTAEQELLELQEQHTRKVMQARQESQDTFARAEEEAASRIEQLQQRLQQQLETYQRDSQTWQQQMADMSESTTTTIRSLQQQLQQASEMESDMQRRQQDVLRTEQELQGQLAALREEKAMMESKHAQQMDAMKQSTSENDSSHAAHLSELQRELSSVNESLRAERSTCCTLQSDMLVMETTLNSRATEVALLTTEIATLRTRMDGLLKEVEDTSVDRRRSRGEHFERVAILDSRVRELEEEMEKLEGEKNELHQRVEVLQTELAKSKDAETTGLKALTAQLKQQEKKSTEQQLSLQEQLALQSESNSSAVKLLQQQLADSQSLISKLRADLAAAQVEQQIKQQMEAKKQKAASEDEKSSASKDSKVNAEYQIAREEIRLLKQVVETMRAEHVSVCENYKQVQEHAAALDRMREMAMKQVDELETSHAQFAEKEKRAEQELQRLRDEIVKAGKESTQLREQFGTEIDEMATVISGLRIQLDETHTEITTLRKSKQDHSESISSLETECARLRKQFTEANTLANKLFEQEEMCIQLQARMAELVEENVIKTKQMEQLQGDYIAASSSACSLTDEVAALQTKISVLEKEKSSAVSSTVVVTTTSTTKKVVNNNSNNNNNNTSSSAASGTVDKSTYHELTRQLLDMKLEKELLLQRLNERSTKTLSVDEVLPLSSTILATANSTLCCMAEIEGEMKGILEAAEQKEEVDDLQEALQDLEGHMQLLRAAVDDVESKTKAVLLNSSSNNNNNNNNTNNNNNNNLNMSTLLSTTTTTNVYLAAWMASLTRIGSLLAQSTEYAVIAESRRTSVTTFTTTASEFEQRITELEKVLCGLLDMDAANANAHANVNANVNDNDSVHASSNNASVSTVSKVKAERIVQLMTPRAHPNGTPASVRSKQRILTGARFTAMSSSLSGAGAGADADNTASPVLANARVSKLPLPPRAPAVVTINNECQTDMDNAEAQQWLNHLHSKVDMILDAVPYDKENATAPSSSASSSAAAAAAPLSSAALRTQLVGALHSACYALGVELEKCSLDGDANYNNCDGDDGENDGNGGSCNHHRRQNGWKSRSLPVTQLTSLSREVDRCLCDLIGAAHHHIEQIELEALLNATTVNVSVCSDMPRSVAATAK